VERQQIRYQVIVFDELTLLIAHVLGDDALATETHPLHEFVEGFAFVGGSLDCFWEQQKMISANLDCLVPKFSEVFLADSRLTTVGRESLIRIRVIEYSFALRKFRHARFLIGRDSVRHQVEKDSFDLQWEGF
jgi:hypothetical protein